MKRDIGGTPRTFDADRVRVHLERLAGLARNVARDEGGCEDDHYWKFLEDQSTRPLLAELEALAAELGLELERDPLRQRCDRCEAWKWPPDLELVHGLSLCPSCRVA